MMELPQHHSLSGCRGKEFIQPMKRRGALPFVESTARDMSRGLGATSCAEVTLILTHDILPAGSEGAC